MHADFNIKQWIIKVAEERPFIDQLVSELHQYGAVTEPDDESNDVASLHYSAKFYFPGGVTVTIGIMFMDHQTNSDLVIETMTTLPEIHLRKGYGSQAISKLQHWARASQLKEVRATQVRGEENEGFWRKHSFSKAPSPNPCNDFVWHPY